MLVLLHAEVFDKLSESSSTAPVKEAAAKTDFKPSPKDVTGKKAQPGSAATRPDAPVQFPRQTIEKKPWKSSSSTFDP